MAILEYPSPVVLKMLPVPQERVRPASVQPIAVTACACRLPGVDTPEDLWKALISGTSPIRAVPESWIDSRLYYDPKPGKTAKTYSRLAAIFDRQRIEDEVAANTFPESFRCDDPVLKSAFLAVRETLARTRLENDEKRIGIYLGGLRASEISYDYMFSTVAPAMLETLHTLPEFLELPPEIRDRVFRRSLDEVARRYRRDDYWKKASPRFKIADFVAALKNTFDWSGPAFSLDAACASSLLAAECACNDLRDGRIRGALVGAISSMSPLSLVLFSKNFAAATEKSCPFDQEANGVVSSMGLVFVFLKTLRQAKKDGDDILGVVRNVGFSTDGRGKTFWAPRTEGQMLAVRRAYDQTALTPRRLNYLEAHATSTGVGDSTELKTIEGILSDDFCPQTRTEATRRRRKMTVGSVKSHFGHAFEASGLVSLLKVLQMLRNRTIPPQINISRLHDDLHEKEKPFDIALEKQSFFSSAQDPALFGINAFGVGGINAHLVLEEFADHPADRTSMMSGENETELFSTEPAPTDCPVAVVGLGCVYPGAYSGHAFQSLLNSGKDPKKPLSRHGRRLRLFPEIAEEVSDISDTNFVGGFIEDYQYDWHRHRIPPLQIERCDPLQTFVMGAVDEAMSGRHLSDKVRDNTFVVIGADHDSNFFHEFLTVVRGAELADIVRECIIGSAENAHDGNSRNIPDDLPDGVAAAFVKKIQKEHSCISDVTGGFSTSSLASRITKLYDLHGGAFAVDAGAPSSLVALDYAVRKINREPSALGICGGAYRWTNPHAFEYHAARNPATAFPLAEGAGVVLLKALTHVDRKTETPYAVIRSTIPISKGRLDALFRDMENVDAIAFVAVASPGAVEHLASLASGFRAAGRSEPIPITSCHPRLGNLVSGGGMAELIAASFYLNAGEIPPQAPFWKRESIDDLFYVSDEKLSFESRENLYAVVLDLDESGNGVAVLLSAIPKASHETPDDAWSLRRVERPLPFVVPKKTATETGVKVAPAFRFRQVGSHYEMGFGLGLADSARIARLMDSWKNASEQDRREMIDVDRLSSRMADFLGEDGFDELRGLADGSGIAFEELFAHNMRVYDALRARHFVIRFAEHRVDPDGNQVVPFLHVAAFDSPLRKILGADLDVLVLNREPSGSFAHTLVGVAGCIGGCIGFNAFGMSVSASRNGSFPNGLLPGVVTPRILGRYDVPPDVNELRSDLPNANGLDSLILTNHVRGDFTETISSSQNNGDEPLPENWNELTRFSRNALLSPDGLGCVWLDRNAGVRLIAPF